MENLTTEISEAKHVTCAWPVYAHYLVNKLLLRLLKKKKECFFKLYTSLYLFIVCIYSLIIMTLLKSLNIYVKVV